MLEFVVLLSTLVRWGRKQTPTTIEVSGFIKTLCFFSCLFQIQPDVRKLGLVQLHKFLRCIFCDSQSISRGFRSSTIGEQEVNRLGVIAKFFVIRTFTLFSLRFSVFPFSVISTVWKR